jgi:hypothetical protein
MNNLRTTAYATAILIATLALASCDRREPSTPSAPSGTATAPSPPAAPASPASR